jgi:hypothetical protein
MELMTGSQSIVCNVWSDEARGAAAAARKGRANYKGLSEKEQAQFHRDYNAAQRASADAHGATADKLDNDKGTHQDAADKHTIAAEAHDRAANSAPDEKTANKHIKESQRHRDLADAHNESTKGKVSPKFSDLRTGARPRYIKAKMAASRANAKRFK